MKNKLYQIYKIKYINYIKNLCLDEDTLNDLIDEKFIESNPEFYLFYPKLFDSYFNLKGKSEDIDLICIAGYLYYQSIILLDALIDEKKFKYISKILVLQEEAIKILSSIFHKNSLFWTDWNKSRNEYFLATKIEKELLQKKDVSIKEYSQLADYKSSFGKIAISAMYELNNRENSDIYIKLIESHKHFSVAFQLFDDLTDFKEDYNKQFNWAVYCLLKKRKLQDINVMNKYLYIDGVSQELMKSAINYLNKSKLEFETKHSKNYNWLVLIEETKNKIDSDLDATNGYIEIIKTKINLSRISNIKKDINFDIIYKDKLISNALLFIKNDYLKNFSELKHIMYLSNKDGFINADKVHIGDVFQRGLVLDCLLDVQERYGVLFKKYIENEIDYFITNTTKNRIKIWSYFQTVKEISADADDLGQILQVFIRTGKVNIIKIEVDKAINILLNDRYHKDGGIETWIIPNKNKTISEKKQEYFNNKKWGKGPDNEVMANFLYALSLYDFSQYKNKILDSADFLINRQDKNGFWNSRWYYGKYYGTYVSLRLLSFINIENHKLSISKAITFIKNTQNKDGGWGFSNNSDPLNTSFAILALKLYAKKHKTEIEKAIRYLKNNQDTDGSWKAINFIQPKTYTPYKSKVMTTSFVLKALTNKKNVQF